MNIQDWASLIVAILTIVSSVAFGIKWLVKHYFNDIKAEFKPNGGSSLKDQINRLEIRISEADVSRRQMKEDHKVMKAKLDHMYDILLDYISKSK
jgi:hypothetical protein